MSMMSAKLSDLLLALKVADWLDSHKCTTSISSKDGIVFIHYTLQKDMKPQPALRVKEGKITIPEGTETAVVAAFLGFFH